MESQITVSDRFIEIYQYFNVSDQTESMKSLSREELYLLLDTCVDSHDDEDTTVQLNFRPFIKELKELLELHNGKSVTDPDLNKLKNENTFLLPISSDSGDNLPDIFTKNEVREMKLNKIFEK